MMNRTLSLVVLLAAFALLSGCATTSVVRPVIQDSYLVEAPYDKAWSAIVATAAEKSLPVKSIEKDSGLLTTDFVTLANGYSTDNQLKLVAQKPSIFLGVWEGARYALSIYATPQGEGSTKIKITSQIQGYESNVTKQWHVCYSTGTLEEEFFISVRSKLL